MGIVIQEIRKKLEAGQKPTYEDLDRGFVEALEERRRFLEMSIGLTQGMSNIVVAYVAGDYSKIEKILADLVALRVRFVRDSGIVAESKVTVH